jgi:serine/threonine protein kinase
VAICPKCQRTSEALGYCPYDGSALVAELGPGTPPPVRPQVVIDSRGSGRVDVYEGLIGQTLDHRYAIEARLGEGGMGVVFRARHVVIEKPVAIKVLKRHVARDNNVVSRFVQEARAASRIGHPNIIDVTDFGVTASGMTYQVMEYLEGQTLSAAIRAEGRMSPDRALPILAQLCRALGAAHDKGIVHRDLKPENVFLLARDGRRDFVKVVDFGIAKVQPVEGAGRESGPMRRLTRAGSVFGTPEYMAPEQALGKGDTDHRVDVYALGTILFEMLVGRVPHKGESAMRTLAMQLMEPIPTPREVAPDLAISDQLEAIVMRALAREREDRYQSTGELLAALGAAAGDRSLSQPLSATVTYPDADDGAARGERATDHGYADGPERAPREWPGPGDRSGPVPASQLGQPDRAAAEPVTAVSRRRRRWPLFAALVAIGGSLAAVLASRDASERTGSAAPAADAAAVAALTPLPDAGASPVVPSDAATTPVVVSNRRRSGSLRPGTDPARSKSGSGSGSGSGSDSGSGLDSGSNSGSGSDSGSGSVESSGPSRSGSDLSVQVLTEPRGGRLYMAGQDGGPDGTNFQRPQGTVLELECRQYDQGGAVTASGRLKVSFDGDQRVVVCRMKPRTNRKKKCVEGLKSPFDDCE